MVDTTYFGELFSAVLNGPPWAFQWLSSSSSVQRPNSHPARPPPAAILSPIVLAAASPAVAERCPQPPCVNRPGCPLRGAPVPASRRRGRHGS